MWVVSFTPGAGVSADWIWAWVSAALAFAAPPACSRAAAIDA